MNKSERSIFTQHVHQYIYDFKDENLSAPSKELVGCALHALWELGKDLGILSWSDHDEIKKLFEEAGNM